MLLPQGAMRTTTLFPSYPEPGFLENRSSTKDAPRHQTIRHGGTPSKDSSTLPSLSANTISKACPIKNVWTDEHLENQMTSPAHRSGRLPMNPRSLLKNVFAAITLQAPQPVCTMAMRQGTATCPPSARPLIPAPPVAKGPPSPHAHAPRLRERP